MYAESGINHELLAKYPEHGEHEMLETFQPDGDLTGEIPASKELFQVSVFCSQRKGGRGRAEEGGMG